MPITRRSINSKDETEELDLDLTPEEDDEEEIKSIDHTVSAGKQYILKSRIIDKYTTIRRRIKLTASMCKRPHCNFDVAVANGFSGWDDDISDRERTRLLEALAMHDKQVHSIAEDIILNEDEVPTNWLGGKK